MLPTVDGTEQEHASGDEGEQILKPLKEEMKLNNVAIRMPSRELEDVMERHAWKMPTKVGPIPPEDLQLHDNQQIQKYMRTHQKYWIKS